MKFVVDLNFHDEFEPTEVADWLLDLLCHQQEAPYESCDGVDPVITLIGGPE